MAFITHVSPSHSRMGLFARLLIGALALLLLPHAAWSAEFRVHRIDSRLVDQVFLLDANIDYDLSATALDALSSGIPLTLRLDISIERVRRWMWNEEVAALEQRYELSYHALSRQYLVRNLNSGGVYTYPTLQSALEALGEIRSFPLLDQKLIDASEAYRGSLRAYLDIEALPSPLRPIAYISPAWHLGSDWHQWSLEP